MSGDRHAPREQVVTAIELGCRPSRPPDYASESRALARLMEAVAAQCQLDGTVQADGIAGVLQNLAQTALELCRAHSAGISILEEQNGLEVFRWRATAGQWRIGGGEVMPPEGPHDTMIDGAAVALMAYPERHQGSTQSITLPIAEALLVPFHFGSKPIGTIWVISHDHALRFDAEDQRLITSLGRFAANVYRLLNQERLASELAATQRLQEISTQLLVEDQVDVLYEKLLEAAQAIMRSDCASMQMLYPDRGNSGELRLLASRGFTPEAAKFWQWVPADSGSTCSAAMRTRARVVARDVDQCDFIVGTPDQLMYRQAGIRSVQTTPLISRDGKLLGMISTHWRQLHEPAEHELRLLDVLARQAADLIERSLAEQRTQMLLREVSHRGKNLLAVAQALVRQTAGADTCAFAQSLSGRLASLAASQELLVQSDWRGVDMSELVRSQLSHFRDLIGTRIECGGPPLSLAPSVGQTLGMAIHELATNAAKYGALANGEGTVAISWQVTADARAPRFVMSWCEHGGPEVAPPGRKGFGHSVLVRMTEHALDGEVTLAYDASGVAWQVAAPLSSILDGNGGPSTPRAGGGERGFVP